MHRRDLIKSLTGVAALAAFTDVLKAEGIDVQTVSEKTAENAVLIVFRYPGLMSTENRQQFRRCAEQLFKDTPMERVPIAVLEEGMSLEVVTSAKRGKWRLVDEMIEEHGDGQ